MSTDFGGEGTPEEQAARIAAQHEELVDLGRALQPKAGRVMTVAAARATGAYQELHEGQDHEGETPSLAEIRLHRTMRLLIGLAVPVVVVIGLFRIAEADGLLDAVLETAGTIAFAAITAMMCAYAGVRATQLQTEYDEATAPSTNE